MIRFGSLERDYLHSKGDLTVGKKKFKIATRQRCSAAQFTWITTTSKRTSYNFC